MFSFGIAKVDKFSLPPNFFAKFFKIFLTLCRFKSNNSPRALKHTSMDIDLLSKMVKELILDNDKVVLPGLGCFVAEMVPSTFSDKGYTINPPYRRLFFRAKPDMDDVLTRFYASTNKVEMEVADRIILDFISELKSVLYTRKTVIFPGLGRLRATKENNVFFVADEDLDIYPAGFGLEPISLKTHQESAEEVSAAIEGFKSILSETPAVTPEQVAEPDPEPVPVEEVASVEESEPVVETVEEVDPSDEPVADTEPVKVTAPKRKGLWVIVALLVLAVIAAAAFVVVSRVAPELLDPILYTPEELEILNYQL